ncbi:helix-turn-helix domain-containing protein [Bacillus sp. CMF21]|uniref:ArsR/SmtB family transcription factor n=1 Tax=Metabacillus dongyingensis TaxID=2874282 RepID=UPI001CBCB321|nr:helix-turn-helix domain-containing protein [Metabacillus dongyingensis]UAL53706.1 helix-turn-helix domain-containing protein [Metabacillus dongyingensis]USK30017.1 helix-turn-helix domain-containing protein [Bacillus sp. CMF21]
MKQQLNGDQLLKVLEALSNPYRLKILAVLYKERQYVSQLARQLGISRPLLYLHLQKLEDAELIKGHHEISEVGKAMKYFELIPFCLPIDESMIASVAESVTIKKKKE